MRLPAVALSGLLVALAPAAAQEPEGSYSRTPAELVPYRGVGQPYDEFLREPPEFRGMAQEAPEQPSQPGFLERGMGRRRAFRWL